MNFHRLCLAISLTAAAALAAAEEKPISVAIFDFRGFHPPQRREATALIVAGLSQDKRLAVFDRAQLGKILSEQALDLSHDIDVALAMQLGRLTGARVIITGRVVRATDGGIYPVVAQIVSTGTGRVFTETVQGHRERGNTRIAAAVEELNILLIDRESADALDLTEEITIATAVETAADALAARLVPRLSKER